MKYTETNQIIKEYTSKLKDIKKVMKPQPMADALGCSVRSIPNMIEDIGLTRIGMTEKIDAVHKRVVIK